MRAQWRLCPREVGWDTSGYSSECVRARWDEAQAGIEAIVSEQGGTKHKGTLDWRVFSSFASRRRWFHRA